MGLGVLTLLWAWIAFAAPGDTSAIALPSPGAGRMDSALSAPRLDSTGFRSKDSTKLSSARHPMPRPLTDSAPAWTIPVRSGSAGWALDQAFRDGAQGVPWRHNFEFDGMWESWQPWTGLPLDEHLSRLSWDGPSLAGASDAGPLAGVAVESSTRTGFGGQSTRWIRPPSVPSDTPSTSIHFFRGALASYRFGLDFSRAVWGPWGFGIGMETRSSESLNWLYRDQIQDMFQGSFGRLRQDLPATGQSPGQDDAQWQAVATRGDPDSRLDVGWSWTDLRRGVPDPTMVWGGPAKPPFPGDENRSGWFARWIRQQDLWRLEATVRIGQEQWMWPAWSDSGTPVAASGNLQREDGQSRIRWGEESWGIGLEASGENLNGTRSVYRLDPLVNEDQERGGVFAEAKAGGFRAHAGMGWTRLSTSENGIYGALDARGGIEWTDSIFSGLAEYRREVKLPDENVERPDPLLRTLPAPGLSPELRDLVQIRGSLSPIRGWSLDAAGALLEVRQAIQPLSAPSATDSIATRENALQLSNSGQVLGWSGQIGTGWSGRILHARTQWAMGWTGLPGRSLSHRDTRLAQWQSRSNLGWSRGLLDGRLRVQLDADLRTWGDSWAWTGVAQDAQAHAVRLPASSQMDLECQVGIKTFVIDWRLENIFDERQTPAAGWTPPGIRAGWGITWNFGG